MPRSVGSLALALALASPVYAQSAEEQEVLRVITGMFDAMRTRDTAAFRASMHPEARIVVTGTNQSGALVVRPIPVDTFVANIGRTPVQLDERIYSPEVRIDGNLATVWTRYEFVRDGSFSHCGHDSFHLARMNGAWKIVQVADTQRREPARCSRGQDVGAINTPRVPGADSAAVIAATQRLFDAMKSRDSLDLRSVWHAAGKISPVGPNGPRIATAEDFARQIRSIPAGGDIVERMVMPEVRIHDNLATVWTWYDLHIGEQFSHCGYDAAQVVRTEDGWKLLHISWTTKQTGCQEPRR